MCNDVIQINNEGERCWLNFMKWLENKDSTWIYRGVSDNEYTITIYRKIRLFIK